MAQAIQKLQEKTPEPTAMPTPSIEPAPTPTAKPAAPKAKAESNQGVKVSAATPAIIKPLRPLEGEVLRPFSPAEPVYFPTLNEWMVHMGIDIIAAEGADIMAALDGTVESLGQEAGTGLTAILTHSDGKKTVYGNLFSLDGLKKGQEIKRGTIIGKVGRSANSTLTDPAHLHFEYHEGGKAVNPADYWQAP